MVSFIMQAAGFWDEVVMLTETATVKTENLQRIVNLAGKKTDPVKILKGSGTRTMMASFKDRWMEVAEMISSDRNNVIFDKVVLTQLMLKLTVLTGFSPQPYRNNLRGKYLYIVLDENHSPLNWAGEGDKVSACHSFMS